MTTESKLGFRLLVRNLRLRAEAASRHECFACGRKLPKGAVLEGDRYQNMKSKPKEENRTHKDGAKENDENHN